MSIRQSCINLILAIGVASTLSAVALADFVPIQAPPGSELGHSAILEGVYSPGTPWTGFARPDGGGNPVDWTNGTLSALRVDDFGRGGVLDVNAGAAGLTDDRAWIGGPVTATARARYAGYAQELGYTTDGQTGNYIKLFGVSGSGFNVAGTAVLDLAPGQSWNWTRSGSGQVWFSEQQYNVDGLDHMVTYEITGLADGLKHWMIFWEDLPNLGDQDYNDLAVELTAPVPEPTAGVMTLVTIGLLSGRRRWGVC